MDPPGCSLCSIKDEHFSYNFDDIDQISLHLGIPWDPSKDQQFSHATTYIGFTWDLSSSLVSLSLAKKLKYHLTITEWKSCLSHILKDVKKLHSKLFHAYSVWVCLPHQPGGHVPHHRSSLSSCASICQQRDCPQLGLVALPLATAQAQSVHPFPHLTAQHWHVL